MKKLLLLLIPIFINGIAWAQVLIYGDTRNHPEVHQELIQQVKDIPLELVFYTGDMNQKGLTQGEYDSFRAIISPFADRFYPVRGNHEKNLELYLQNFFVEGKHSYYAMVHDSLKYIILDSNLDLLPGSHQYDWLVQELESAEYPIVLLLHHPIFSSGYHGDELGLQWFIPQLIKKYPVVAVISGHEHSFEHLKAEGVHYFVSGGGGAPLRELENKDSRSLFFKMIHHYNVLTKQTKSIKWECFDLDGSPIYAAEIQLP